MDLQFTLADLGCVLVLILGFSNSPLNPTNWGGCQTYDECCSDESCLESVG